MAISHVAECTFWQSAACEFAIGHLKYDTRQDRQTSYMYQLIMQFTLGAFAY